MPQWVNIYHQVHNGEKNHALVIKIDGMDLQVTLYMKLLLACAVVK